MTMIRAVILLFFVETIVANVCHEVVELSCRDKNVYDICEQYINGVVEKNVRWESLWEESENCNGNRTVIIDELNDCTSKLTKVQRSIDVIKIELAKCQMCELPLSENRCSDNSKMSCNQENGSSWINMISMFFKYASVVIVGARAMKIKSDPERAHELPKLWQLTSLTVAVAGLDTYQLLNVCTPQT
uniref:Uncharacterized protein n=1 Tax=Glypta fumiferanae TaxID=389681 RepID=A0A0F6Q8B9_9HYME|nr:hypothetical protein [Glypta fumiferanae]